MKKKERQIFYTGIVFTVFFFLLMRNLLNASLWLDEGVEYWFSKSIHAVIPGEDVVSTMYERIIRTYQPPLYNVLMYIWLKINDTELWFKLLGVLLGFGAGTALYKAVKLVSNTTVALLSILLLANVYRFVYYVQECAEYNLMLFNICWMLYFFVACLKEFSYKKVFLFTLFCVLAVYSQYGAVFVVTGFAITLFLVYITKKQKNEIKIVSLSYFAAGIVGALPLYIFFAKNQIARQIENTVEAAQNNAQENWVAFFVKGINEVIEYNFIPNNINMKYITHFLLLVVVIMVVWLIIKKDEIVIWYTISSVVTYLLYFLLVKLGVYGHGSFSNRYSLFLLPMLFLEGVMVVGRFYVTYKSTESMKSEAFSMVYGVIAGAVLVYSTLGYGVIGNGWIKEDARDMFKYWYMETPEDAETLVYYGAVPVFSVYLENEEDYIPSEVLNKSERNIILQPIIRDCTKEEYITYFKEIYSEQMPSEIYFVCSHYITNDLDTMLDAFQKLGYDNDIVWEKVQAKVIRLTR